MNQATIGTEEIGEAGRRPGDAVAELPGPEAGALPNLIIIGAQKCGTSGLHYYLSLHPEIAMSRPKELNFFIAERNWPRGIEWYARHFDPGAPIRGEASPNYTAYPQHMGVPGRMAQVVPDAKLIYIVRDPLDRIAAHWVHNYAKRRERGGVAETITHPNTSYLSRSRYFMQINRFLEHYPIEQVLVVDQDDLRDDRAQTLRDIFRFCGADPAFRHPKFDQIRHSSARKRRATRLGMRIQRLSRSRRVPRKLWLAFDVALPLSKPILKPDIAAELPAESLEVLRDDAERLRELTGLEFAHWSI
jgi:hypothetical protein